MSFATLLTTTRYISPIPHNIRIANTKSDIVQIEMETPSTASAENGGYYMRNKEGEVVAVASDRLCSVLDDSHVSLNFHLKRDGEHEEAKGVLEAGIDADKLVREANDDIRAGSCVMDPENGEDCEDDEDDDEENGYLMDEAEIEQHEL
ncbi:hypothetical protein N7478_006867 [Penicillium angulare]|uniref:uncharacterized protein n=1 Tax=Penicillium angulare TaxID=116970 RepID=UPI0025400AAB|nr:uncharacterized protein N7478_006867 [Penicillium angulare]KAJ5281495.1 hypothetical protein N7478_006867 [Penicillium angulare]